MLYYELPTQATRCVYCAESKLSEIEAQLAAMEAENVLLRTRLAALDEKLDQPQATSDQQHVGTPASRFLSSSRSL